MLERMARTDGFEQPEDPRNNPRSARLRGRAEPFEVAGRADRQTAVRDPLATPRDAHLCRRTKEGEPPENSWSRTAENLAT